jgi:hypothetical protein
VVLTPINALLVPMVTSAKRLQETQLLTLIHANLVYSVKILPQATSLAFQSSLSALPATSQTNV